MPCLNVPFPSSSCSIIICATFCMCLYFVCAILGCAFFECGFIVHQYTISYHQVYKRRKKLDIICCTVCMLHYNYNLTFCSFSWNSAASSYTAGHGRFGHHSDCLCEWSSYWEDRQHVQEICRWCEGQSAGNWSITPSQSDHRTAWSAVL